MYTSNFTRKYFWNNFHLSLFVSRAGGWWLCDIFKFSLSVHWERECFALLGSSHSVHCATLCARKLRKEERRKQIFRCGLSWSTLTTLSLESTSTTLHTTLHRTIIGLQAQLPTILIFIFNPLHHPHQPSIAVSNIYILPDTAILPSIHPTHPDFAILPSIHPTHYPP